MIHLDFARQISPGRLHSLSTEALTPEILCGKDVTEMRFDPKTPVPFISLKTASSFGNKDRFFETFRNVMFSNSIVLVV